MSFNQKNTPLRQYAGVPLDLKAIQASTTANPAFQYGLSKGLTGAEAFKSASSTPKDYASLVQRQNAFLETQNAARIAGDSSLTAKWGNPSVVNGANVIPANPSSQNATLQNSVRGFAQPTANNTINNGPQSTVQNNTSGWRKTDSHNINTNQGSMFNNPAANASAMFSPFRQLKKEQMEYNKISPKAFSNSGTIEKMMGKAIPNSPFMQMIDPLTGVAIDPTMSQDPNAPAPINTGTPLPPPLGVQTPIVPTYDLNNQ